MFQGPKMVIRSRCLARRTAHRFQVDRIRTPRLVGAKVARAAIRRHANSAQTEFRSRTWIGPIMVAEIRIPIHMCTISCRTRQEERRDTVRRDPRALKNSEAENARRISVAWKID
jgi:hypothetical protein